MWSVKLAMAFFWIITSTVHIIIMLNETKVEMNYLERSLVYSMEITRTKIIGHCYSICLYL